MQTTDNSFLSPAEIDKLSFKKIGKNVLISKKASLYNMDEILIGDNVRIDDFCILSGKITLGNFIHISAHCALYGALSIEMKDFSGLSPGCKVFSSTDDFSGNFLVGPMVPEKFTNITGGPVEIGCYAQIGSGSVIMPGISVGEGSAVGAMSLVNKSLDPWGIYAGIPAKYLKERSKKLIDLVSKIQTP